MPKKLDEILDECLNRILAGGEDIERCLGDYPDVAAELEPLLRTTLAIKSASVSVQPRPAFKEAAKQRFLAEISAKPQKQRRAWQFPVFRWQQRWAVALASVLLVLLVGGSGTVAASTNSMPDEFLYPVKIATEQVQVAFTRSDMGKAELEAKFADRRVNEIARMAEEGNEDKVEMAAERLSKHLERIGKVAAAQKAKGAVKEEDVSRFKTTLAQYATEHPLVLEKALEKTSAKAKVAIRSVLNTSQKSYAAAIQNVNIAVRTTEASQIEKRAEVKTVRGIIRIIAERRWIVNKEVVNIDQNTVISGAPQIGSGAHIEAKVQPDGSLLAQKVMVLVSNPPISKTVGIEKSPRALERAEKPTVKAVAEPQQLDRKPVIRTAKGIIENISDTGWTINNRKVIIDADTSIVGEPKVGQIAEVTVQIRPNGSLVAKDIAVSAGELRTPTRIDKPTVKPATRIFSGVVREIADREWIVGGRTLVVDANTAIEGEPKVGHVVKVTVRVQPDGILVAERIEVQARKLQSPRITEVEKFTVQPVPSNETPVTKTYKGFIREISDTEWTIGQRTVPIDRDTKIEGTPAIGLPVEVTVRISPDGSVVVERIKVYPKSLQVKPPMIEPPSQIVEPESPTSAPVEIRPEIAPHTQSSPSMGNSSTIVKPNAITRYYIPLKEWL